MSVCPQKVYEVVMKSSAILALWTDIQLSYSCALSNWHRLRMTSNPSSYQPFAT